ncbi:MAG: hypothetical protein DIKNOCCD_01605 [bacterium]|nr:CRISPR-associated protein Cas4 [bacterium]MBV6481876.1 hypothetical protein [bacterium]
MASDEDLLPISGLQHLAFCERQCALNHIELVWEESQFTAEGRILHEKAHQSGGETHGDTRVAFSVRLCSWTLGLSGIADVVEFHKVPQDNPEGGVVLRGRKGLWLPYPVEYKRGKPKKNDCDKVQLCAQAICLEEMLKTNIPRGAIFYGKTRHRLEVTFDDPLRKKTGEVAARYHALIREGKTPPARYEPKCDQCSILEICKPEKVASGRSANKYLDRAIRESLMAITEDRMDEDS